jgi:hypothetical protein
VSNEVISQSERHAPPTPNDAKAPAEELAERLKLLGAFTRLQLTTTLTKVFEDLARRDPDEIFKRSHEVLELTQAADIVHGWSREKPDVWY